MSAVAYVTEMGNVIRPTDAVSRILGPALKKRVTMLNLMTAEEIPADTNVKKMRKRGFLTAVSGTTAESTAVALATGGEYTETAVTLTAAKMAISSGLSAEEERWGHLTMLDLANEQADAIARGVDNDALSLLSGFSSSVTCATGATLEDLYTSYYTIRNKEVPLQGVQLAVVIAPKAQLNLNIQTLQSQASAFMSERILTILGGKPQANNLVASIPLFDIYVTTGFGTSGGDNVQGVIHPQLALCGIFDGSPLTWTADKVTEGLYKESGTFYFYDVAEFYDEAGVCFLSDT